MSPITHALIGWLIAQPLPDRRDRSLVTALALVPDLDGLALLGGVELYQRWHHTFGHNIFMAAASVALLNLWARDRTRFTALGVASFHSHLLCDLLGSGAEWPIFYFWPVSWRAFQSAPPLQWELASWQNLLVTLFCLAWVISIGLRKGRTVLETLSGKADAKVVAVLRNRLS